jgi:hypothetical protein
VQRFVAEGVFVPRPAINRLELCPPDATFCWKRARISSQLQVHIPSARHAADGCSCPLQHHRLGHHDRAFQTILCASCHRRPRALHISARHEQTRAAYAANEAPTHPNTHQPARPAFILRLLPVPVPVFLRSLHHLRILTQSFVASGRLCSSSLVHLSSRAFLSPARRRRFLVRPRQRHTSLDRAFFVSDRQAHLPVAQDYSRGTTDKQQRRTSSGAPLLTAGPLRS